jgi:DNA-binding response OmpR family regulator
LLARKRGEPVSKAAILRHVWDDEGRDPNVVEVYVNYLRHKLERGGASRIIHTVRGRGYVLSEVASD